MQRIEDLLTLAIAAAMPGHFLALSDHADFFRVGLDRHYLKSPTTRHAVVVVIETHQLEFVDLGRLLDARVEGMRRQSQTRRPLSLETRADRFGVFAALPRQFPQTT